MMMNLSYCVTETGHADPLQHHDYFNVRNLVSVDDLMQARVHLGHKFGVRNSHMSPFIFGSRLGVDIIDLDQTVTLLGDALNFVAHVAYRGGIALFVSRHRPTIPLVEQTAINCGEYSHCSLWRGGTITNAAVQYGFETRLPDVMIFLSTLNDVFNGSYSWLQSAQVSIWH